MSQPLPSHSRGPSRPRRRVVSTVILAAAVAGVALAGCANKPDGAVPPPRQLPVSIPLGTSLSTPAATWATVRTGGAAVGGKFWQLLVRPAGSTKWRLVTPPGVADNGGLAVAASGSSATVGFVPSAQLTFTPLAVTTDDGAHWKTGLLDAGLQAAPDALATLPGGRLLAVTAKGAQESAPGGGHWSTLVTLKALASTPAAAKCGLTALTAAAAGPSGRPLLAGTCSDLGRGYVFEHSSAGWTGVGLRMIGQARGLPVTVLAMAASAHGMNVLLQAGTGQHPQLWGAVLAYGVMQPVTKIPTTASARQVSSTFASPANGLGALVGRSFLSWFEPGSAARSSLPRAVSGATLAFASTSSHGTEFSVLVPGLDTVQVWQFDGTNWHQTQVIKVPLAPA
jgi:hypothetical protein